MFDTSQANCLGLDTEMFFPVGQLTPTTEAQLKRVCMSCLVFDKCLDYAIKVKLNGYWAGTTETKRLELRKFFKITAIRIDEEYRRKTETNEARNSRTYRERLREAGAS